MSVSRHGVAGDRESSPSTRGNLLDTFQQNLPTTASLEDVPLPPKEKKIFQEKSIYLINRFTIASNVCPHISTDHITFCRHSLRRKNRRKKRTQNDVNINIRQLSNIHHFAT